MRYYEIVLVKTGPAKLQTVKIVKEETSLGLKEAYFLVSSVPSTILDTSDRTHARRLAKHLRENGCTIKSTIYNT